MQQNYCRRCGTSLAAMNDYAFHCKNNHVIYANPAPTVGIFLFDTDGMLLLSVRGIEPYKGTLDCFGGFVDGSETIEQAVARELKEELGLAPHDYSVPTYFTSATNLYEFGGENVRVISSMFYATLTPTAVPKAADDVASIQRTSIEAVSLDDIGGDDIKQAFAALRKLRATR